MADPAFFPPQSGTTSAVSTTSNGLALPGMYMQAFRRGANLTDADITIDPNADKCNLYVLPAGTLTGNRSVTVASTSPAGTIVLIVVEDISANTYTIKSNAGATLWTKAASPGQAICFQVYTPGDFGNFTANTRWWSPS